MRFLAALLLVPLLALAQPAPIAPVGVVYTQAQPVTPRGAGSYCGANIHLVPVTFSWQAVAGAGGYEIQAQDGCTVTPALSLDAWRSSSVCTNGVCSFTTNGSYIADSLTAIWSIRATDANGNGIGPWSPNIQFVINPPGINTYSATPCSWYFSSDAPGIGRRIVDYSSERTGSGIFPKGQWLTLNVTDLVPAGAQAVAAKAQLIQGITFGEPILGFKTRRHGSTVDPEPYGGFMYTTSYRHNYDTTVLLDANGNFDFFWNDASNGNPSCQSAGTCGTVSQALTLMVMGYCK